MFVVVLLLQVSLVYCLVYRLVSFDLFKLGDYLLSTNFITQVALHLLLG